MEVTTLERSLLMNMSYYNDKLGWKTRKELVYTDKKQNLRFGNFASLTPQMKKLIEKKLVEKKEFRELDKRNRPIGVMRYRLKRNNIVFWIILSIMRSESSPINEFLLKFLNSTYVSDTKVDLGYFKSEQAKNVVVGWKKKVQEQIDFHKKALEYYKKELKRLNH